MNNSKCTRDKLNKYISEICNLLVEDIPINKKFKIKNNVVIIKPRGIYFDSDSVYYIAKMFKSIIHKYNFMSIDVVLDLTSIEMFNDKNTYIFLDLLIYYFFYNSSNNVKLYIDIDINLSEVTHNGLINATFMRVLNIIGGGKAINHKVFIDKYTDFLNGRSEEMQNIQEKKNNNYYRKIVTKHTFESVTQSIIDTEISHILQLYYDEDWVDDVVETISEIISNVYSHNNEFVLIDIDICSKLIGKDDETNKKIDEGINYSALNISIINLGQELLYGALKKNIIEKKYSQDIDVYSRVYKAYNNHKEKFNQYYTENHFFAITAFQNKVTTRNLHGTNSGTGLNRLINNIIGKTEQDISYVMSGNIGLRFINEFMHISNDGLIGFNTENNYVSGKPNESTLESAGFYIPGTIYQLHLIKEV